MLKFLCCVLSLCLWRGLIHVEACGFSQKKPLFPDYDESLPKKFLYKERGILNVVLTLRNVPRQANSYEIHQLKNYEPYEEAIHDGRWLTDPPRQERTAIVSFNVTLNKSNSDTTFEVFLKANGGFCNRKRDRKFLEIVYNTQAKQSANKHIKITLDWKNECNNIPAAKTDASPKYSYSATPPVVSPPYFEDSGGPFAVFTCTARCYPDEVLAWFQDKHSVSPTVLLVNQTHHQKWSRNIMYMQITLNKTLEEADRNTSLFCGKRVISLNKYGIMELRIPVRANKVMTSTQIELKFNRTIIRMETPTVTVEPSSVVYFEPNTTVDIVCSSTLVDGCTLDWYEEDLNSTSKRLLTSTQIITETTITKTLKLYVDEVSVSKNIYCVQEHRLLYKNINEEHHFRYGVVARSEPIKLQRQKAEGDRAHKLMIAGACVVGAVAVLLAGLLVSRRGRRQSPGEDEGGDYVVPQITYAVLALPETDSKPPDKPDKQNYVEIVGVYKNKSRNK